ARRRKVQRRQWVIGLTSLLLIVGAIILINLRLGSDVAFADVMERLSQQTAFRTSGVLLKGSPRGTIQHHQFEQIAEREEAVTPRGEVCYKVRWRQGESSPSDPSAFQSRVVFPANLDFPNVLFVETQRDDRGDIVKSRLFPPLALENKSRYQFMFTGLLLMSRSAADQAIHHPAVGLEESQEMIAGKPSKVFSLTVRDTQGNAVCWKLHVSYQTRLPYRVEVTYRTKADVVRQADYVVEYPSRQR
ncbi:MAG: hypothetical protein NZT92_15380, partial [Abditibacteriales bacterium]|nr:hypothetical protein [Abditibacteriales bacterium]MDW8367326.1 hypothetical protein [Abditibacteriales bacterium]